MLKNIQIFKVGSHQDSAGNQKEWTEADLQKIVEQYNSRDKTKPALRAQLVLGHEANSGDPAYGYAETLYFSNGILSADVVVAPQLAEMVKNHMYQNISISLSDKHELRHIAFLGAEKPAVKDLAALDFGEIKFNEADKLSIWKTEQNQEIKKINFNYNYNGKDMNMTTEQLEKIVSDFRTAHGEAIATAIEKAFSPLVIAPAKKEEDNNDQFSEHQKEINALKQQLRNQEFSAWLEKNIKELNILPSEATSFKNAFDSSFNMNFSTKEGKQLQGVEYLNSIIAERGSKMFGGVLNEINFANPKPPEDDTKFIDDLYKGDK